ncbi:hypothetical protein VCHA48O428_70112 [Vibrio chagasii]|nr:hypothetical protein VCHA48O428_70112 [Vibrio chagasii]
MKKKYLASIPLILTLAGCNNGDEGLLGNSNSNVTSGTDNGDVGGARITPSSNVAPEFKYMGIWAYNAEEPSLRMFGEYFDQEGDLAGVHEFAWYREGQLISNQNLDYLSLNQEYFNSDGTLKSIEGCAIPIARTGTTHGEQVCIYADGSVFGSLDGVSGSQAPSAEISVSGENALGGTVSSQYTYQSPTQVPEGKSHHAWMVYTAESGSLPALWGTDGKKTECADAKAGKACDLTITNELQTSYVYACVSPEDETGLIGYGDCSDSLSTSGTNVPPSISDVKINGSPYPGSALSVSASYLDLDDDKPGYHIYAWEADGNIISGETDNSLILTEEFVGKNINVCVTPIALTGANPGAQVCAEGEGILVESLSDNAPEALARIVTRAPLAGDTLAAAYSYTSSAPESGSAFTWYSEDNAGQRTLLEQCDPSSADEECEYNSKSSDVGKTIMACVIPKNNLGNSGQESCAYAGVDNGSGTFILPGIKVTGVLEYNETLKVEKIGGLQGPISWNMNLDEPFDGTNDLVETRSEIPVDQGGVGDSYTYTIGTMQYIIDNNIISDSDANGIIDDADWQAAGNIANLAAGDFIGKDISVCVDDAAYGGKVCRDVSSFQSDTADSCENSDECVTSGLFLDIGDSAARGIKSQSVIENENGEKLYADTSLADLKYRYNQSEDQLAVYSKNTRSVLGVELPLFNIQDDSDYSRITAHCKLVTSGLGGVAPSSSTVSVRDYTAPGVWDQIDVIEPNILKKYGNPDDMPMHKSFFDIVKNLERKTGTTASPTTGLTFGKGALTSSFPGSDFGLATVNWVTSGYRTYDTYNRPELSQSAFCTSN